MSISINDSDRMVNRQGTVIICAADRSGVGKTTLTHAIASTTAISGMPTLLWDMDMSGSDLPKGVGVNDRSLCDYFEAMEITPQDIDRLTRNEITKEQLINPDKIREVIKKAIVPARRNLYLLARPCSSKLPAIPDSLMAHLLMSIALILRDNFRIVVVDTPPKILLPDYMVSLLAQVDLVCWGTDHAPASAPDNKDSVELGTQREDIRWVVSRHRDDLFTDEACLKVIEAAKKVGLNMADRGLVMPDKTTFIYDFGYINGRMKPLFITSAPNKSGLRKR